MIIYLAHPITGLSYDAVAEYYQEKYDHLNRFGYTVLFPMVAKKYLKESAQGGKIKAEQEELAAPLSTDRAIIGRDRWMVTQADVVYINLEGAKEISIGSCMELGWGYDRRKHTITTMEKKNIHRHAFVNQASDVIFENDKQATKYLEDLIQRRV